MNGEQERHMATDNMFRWFETNIIDK